jgi:hypothetical protein
MCIIAVFLFSSGMAKRKCHVNSQKPFVLIVFAFIAVAAGDSIGAALEKARSRTLDLKNEHDTIRGDRSKGVGCRIKLTVSGASCSFAEW